jgi:indolepyruvate ferredoxin oxidoreductase alpha subunit
MVVLDNKSSAASGHQTNPGVGRDALGDKAPALSIEKIARACGVGSVTVVQAGDLEPKLISVFKEALSTRELSMIIIQSPESYQS